MGFDERWGALAAGLRQRFGPEAERLEAEAKAEAEAPPDEAPPRDHEFTVAVRELKAGLPRIVTHSGAGLYEVGPGKTYSTIQSALDQLWTDQGSAYFTASQYIRVYAGSYAENVAPNTSLSPDPSKGYGFVLEGDPGDDRADIVIAPTGGTAAVLITHDTCTIRHLKVNTTIQYGILTSTGCVDLKVSDCDVIAQEPIYVIHKTCVVEDCDITATKNAGFGVRTYRFGDAMVIRRCRITGTGKGVSTGWAVYSRYAAIQVEACVIDSWRYAIAPVNALSGTTIRNCTIYDCQYGLGLGWTVDGAFTVINTIFKDVDYPYYTSAWPEETATKLGPSFIQRNNCYHGYTAMGYDGSTTKTYAEWIAFGRVDDAGELDATDPLLTDPGSGDFSLAAGSPCRHVGIGAGVLSDHLRNVFDTVCPDIGAASSGTVETPSRPSAEVAAVDGDTITVSIEGDAGTEHRAELVRARTGEVVDSESRDGGGQVSLTAPELCARYFVVASSANAAGRSLPSLPCEVIVPEAEGPLEEVRIGIVSRLAAHAGLAEILGTDETGAVPVYAAGPECPKRLPCVVYTLSGVPDGELDRAGRWLVALALDAWGGSAGVNDSMVSALDEVLHRQPFDTTSWTVKRIGRTGGGTRWADDGRTEIRYTTWSLVVDRCVT